jgi:hypothetical protein
MTSRILILICSSGHKIINDVDIFYFKLANKQFWRLLTAFRNTKDLGFDYCTVETDEMRDIGEGLEYSKFV